MKRENAFEFQNWVIQIFDREVLDRETFLPTSYDEFPCLPPSIETVYISQLFETAGSLIAGYSEEQIAQGLQYLISTAASNCMFLQVDLSVDERLRLRLVDSFFPLHRDLFAKICSDHCGELPHPNRRPADHVCFMMWDGNALKLSPDRPEQHAIDMGTLGILRRVLTLPARACKKSALHGLGHAYGYYPELVAKIIDTFLVNATAIDEGLREYALDARVGGLQ